MTNPCDEIRLQMMDLCWTPQQYQQARQIVEHLQACEVCRQVQADYQAIQASLQPAETVEPAGGWGAFEQRLQRAAQSRPPVKARWGWSIAAGLLISALLLNAALLLRGGRPPVRPVASLPANGTVQFPSDMTDSAIAKAFSTISAAFEGRTDWVMLSDQSSELGLAADPAGVKDLLILRLVVTRGGTAVSQVHLAIVPGATARVTVPSRTGEQLQYVITTDAKDPQRIALWMALEGGKEKDTGLGSITTSLNIPYGQSSRTGQITTREGTYDLSMSLQHRLARETGAGA